MKWLSILLSPEGTDGGAAGAGADGGGANAGSGGGAGAGAAGATAESQDILDETPAGEGGGEGEGVEGKGQQSQQQEPPKPALTKEDIADLVKSIGESAAASRHPQQQQERQPELTQEQFDQMFNVYKPSNDLLARLRNDDANVAIKAVIEMRDGIIKQAMSMVDWRQRQLQAQLKGEFDGQLSPINEYVSTRQATEFRDEFFEKYEDLEPYEEIVDAVAAKLQTSGYKGKSREEVMERFATESKAIVDKLLAAGKTAGQAQPGQNGAGQQGQNGNNHGKGAAGKGASGGSRMSTLLGGGQGGGSRGAGQAAKGPAGIEVFD